MSNVTEKLQKYADAKAVAENKAPVIDFSKEDMPRLREALSTPDVSILIPRVISDVMRDSAEPFYIGSKLLQVVRLTEGRSIEFPAISAMRAADVAEGMEIPEGDVDFNQYKTTEIRVGKSGLKVRVTDEMITDSQWDVVGILLKKAGEALARHKEEKIFTEFTRHGHIVFDNALTESDGLTAEQVKDAHTTGRDLAGQYNNTLSTEDFVNLVIALMGNGMTPTDILMHPLCWSLFAKNDYVSALNMPGLGSPTDNSVVLNPNAAAGRIPFALTVNFSPFIKFDGTNKKFDMYAVDKNNIGILLVKDDIKTEQFDEPLRDIQTIKAIERYGIGILNEGRGVAVAKNMAFAKSYDLPERMYTVTPQI
jgi:hypothetical protein